MFILPGLLGLLVEYYTKAHVLVDSLRTLPVMHVLYLVTGFGLLLDIRLRITRREACPQLGLAIILWAWTLLSVALTGGLLPRELNDTTIYMTLFLMLAQGVQSFRALRLVAASMLAISLFLAVVAVIQAFSPFQCIVLDPTLVGDVAGHPDGRACDAPATCMEDAEPGEGFICERPGPLGTNSIGHGRIRYRGILNDPNELALVLSISLPFAMAPFAQRRTLLRLLLMLAAFAAVLPVIVWTESRTGQVAFITVIVVFIVQRVKVRTILSAAALAVPILLLGGRSGEEADESAMERLQAWDAGLEMLRSSPVWGVGRAQFTEHHARTAHNTFVLATSELGLLGLVLWLCVFYAGLKIVVVAIRRYRGRADGELAHGWARAILATLCAIGAGINFLSLSYHPIVWAYLALPGSYYLAVRRHDRQFHVRFGGRDFLAVAGSAVLYLVCVKAYLLIKGV